MNRTIDGRCDTESIMWIQQSKPAIQNFFDQTNYQRKLPCDPANYQVRKLIFIKAFILADHIEIDTQCPIFPCINIYDEYHCASKMRVCFSLISIIYEGVMLSVWS